MTDRAVVDDDEIKAKIRQRVRQLEDENDYAALMPQPRALVALSKDGRSLVFLVPSKDGEAQWWSICHWDREADHMEPMYRIVDKGQDAHDVLSWYEGELSETRAILRDGLRAVLAEGGRNGA